MTTRSAPLCRQKTVNYAAPAPVLEYINKWFYYNSDGLRHELRFFFFMHVLCDAILEHTRHDV